MDNLKIVYKILVYIEKSMDCDEFDSTFFSTLKISENRLNKILKSMIDDGLISGFNVIPMVGGFGIKPTDPSLTIKGMEYLQENSIMQKIKKEMKEIKDSVPFI